ncbi:unnamed protein product [Rotaria sordida]|uniref:Uncharacterized protein n=1 Tax=Rotaria sordida TaxID=392033 RepID=A0A815JVM8_9BILA|nr:unnamed protein product [Rotaria sordida]
MEESNTLRLKIREIPRKRDDHLNFWRQEWREREKDSVVIGQGLAEFWLLQDPEDNDTEDSPREISQTTERLPGLYSYDVNAIFRTTDMR